MLARLCLVLALSTLMAATTATTAMRAAAQVPVTTPAHCKWSSAE